MPPEDRERTTHEIAQQRQLYKAHFENHFVVGVDLDGHKVSFVIQADDEHDVPTKMDDLLQALEDDGTLTLLKPTESYEVEHMSRWLIRPGFSDGHEHEEPLA